MKLKIYFYLTFHLLFLCSNRVSSQTHTVKEIVPYTVDTLSLTSNNAQIKKLTYTRAYDLDFNILPDSMRLYNWIENAAYQPYSLSWGVEDPTRSLFGKRNFAEFPFMKQLKTEFSQRILLPHNKLKEGVIGFECKGRNLNRITLTLEAIDEAENLLAIETLTYRPDSTLKTHSKHIDLSNASSLNIRINALGEENKDAYIAFSKVKVTLDNKPIDEYPVRLLNPIKMENSLDYICEDDKHCFDLTQINNLKDKQIIALGESVHGNSDIKSFVFRLIEESIKKQNCKLVLMEFPLGKSLFYNRYIHEKAFELDSSLISHPTIGVFLNKLRVYNQGRVDNDKVRLFGIDYTHQKTSSMSSIFYLFDFIAAINKKPQIPELDRLAVLIMKNKLSDAINYLHTHRSKIAELLREDEISCFEFILNLNVQHLQTPSIERYIQRDSTMALCAQFLINKYAKEKSSKVFIYAHAVHTNPVSTYPAVHCEPMGSYLRKAYGNDYCSLIITTEGGDAIATDLQFGTKDKALNKAPARSLEHYLNALTDCSIYFPLKASFDQLVLTRFKGAYHTPEEFFPANLYQRFSGVFFIKHDNKNNVLVREKSFEEVSKEVITKAKRRKEILKEMELRLKQ